MSGQCQKISSGTQCVQIARANSDYCGTHICQHRQNGKQCNLAGGVNHTHNYVLD